ncbi:MAG: hypothetical protein ABFQ64_01080 [Campylobacterota bacterium]
MKLLLVVLIVSLSLNADEMKRIEAIVSDITKLRAEHEGCQTEAKIYSMQLKDERDKNKILLQEMNSFKDLYKREIEYKNRIVKLENKIKNQEKLLKAKENNKKDLITESEPIIKIKEKEKKTLVIKEKTIENLVLVNCEEPNPFPKLVMKKEFSQNDKKVKKTKKLKKQKEVTPKKKLSEIKKIVEPKRDEVEKLERFKASAFRLNKNAAVYDKVNGKKLYEWEEGTSFTSSIKTQNWTKITGYFVDRVWMRSTKELWIKSTDVIKR